MREVKFFATKSVVIKSSYFEFDQLMDVKLRRHQKSLSWVFADFAGKKKEKSVFRIIFPTPLLSWSAQFLKDQGTKQLDFAFLCLNTHW